MIFFSNKKKYYGVIEKKVCSYFSDTWITFIEKYFCESIDFYNIFICPIAGNYGFTLNDNNNAYYITWPLRYYENNQLILMPKWQFSKALAHEFGHCFVNPVIISSSKELEALDDFFYAHKDLPNAYNVRYSVICEYIVRAFAIRFIQEHENEFLNLDIQQEINDQKKKFIFINFFIEQLEEYEKQDQAFKHYYKTILNNIKHLNIKKI